MNKMKIVNRIAIVVSTFVLWLAICNKIANGINSSIALGISLFILIYGFWVSFDPPKLGKSYSRF